MTQLPDPNIRAVLPQEVDTLTEILVRALHTRCGVGSAGPGAARKGAPALHEDGRALRREARAGEHGRGGVPQWLDLGCPQSTRWPARWG